MEEPQDINKQEQPAKFNLLKTLLSNITIPVIVAIVGLIIEYHSGLFQRPDEGSSIGHGYFKWSLFISAALIATLFFVKDSLRIWLQPHRYLREQFSLLAFYIAISVTLIVLVSLYSGVMPWMLPSAFKQAFITKTFPSPDPRTTDYVLLMVLYLFILWILKQQHQKWHGLKSQELYKREQRSESIGFITEGLEEFRRLIKHEPPLRPHYESDSKQFIPQLEPVTDNMAWKDQAKELIRLSSSAYAFDTETGWHDKQNCWVGRNINSGELIFLFPSQDSGSETEIKEYLKYATVVAKKEHLKIGEIIIATQDNLSEPISSLPNVPIRFETETSLLNSLVDFKDYFNDIRRRVQINHLPDSELSLKDVYVPSRFFSPDGPKPDSTLVEYLQTWLNELSQRQLAILGEYGQGKSTAALMLTHHLISENPNVLKRTPLLIELRGTSPRNLTPLQLLGAWASQYNINPQALMRLLIAGRLLLIFEGFDEMALVGDAEMRLKHFRTLWQFAYPNAKIIITGRPNFFLDEEEMKAALGIHKPIGGRPYCEAVRLAPFDPDQIKEALRAYKDTVRNQIHTLSEKNTRFRDLVSRPSLLHIVAVFWERERLFEIVDQLTSAFVMDLFVRHSYRRQGLKDVDSPEFMALTSLEREYFMNGIASYMASNHLPNQITATQLNQVIADLLEAIPESVSTDSSAILGETNRPLRNRVQETEHGIEHVKTDVRACGLLVDDPSSPGTFRFGHKSFMEYLFAAVVAERMQDTDSEKARAIMKATNARIEDILLLPVAIEFLAELIAGGKGESGAAKELTIANQLLRSILGENQRLRFYQWVGIFHGVIVNTLGKKSSLRRIFLRMGPMMLGTFMVIPMYFYVRKNRESGSQSSWDYKLFVLLGATLLIFFAMSLFTLGVIDDQRLELWIHLCKKIGISDKVMHKVTLTNLIPIVKEKPFYSSVDETDMDKINDNSGNSSSLD